MLPLYSLCIPFTLCPPEGDILHRIILTFLIYAIDLKKKCTLVFCIDAMLLHRCLSLNILCRTDILFTRFQWALLYTKPLKSVISLFKYCFIVDRIMFISSMYKTLYMVDFCPWLNVLKQKLDLLKIFLCKTILLSNFDTFLLVMYRHIYIYTIYYIVIRSLQIWRTKQTLFTWEKKSGTRL